jgi:hypothetical protein
MAFPKFGSTPKGARETALAQLPAMDEAEMASVPPAIADARKAYRTLIANMEERKAGGTNLNRMIERNAAEMSKTLKEIGLRSNDVAFPEDATPAGRRAREYLAPYGAQANPRQWTSFAGERATYASTSSGVVPARDLSPLEPWNAPDDSPASRARVARREAINISIEGEYNRVNQRYPKSAYGTPEAAVGREKAALAEVGLDPASVRYPEDARAVGWAALGKRQDAVTWERAAALAPDRTFERKDGAIREIERPTGIADYAQRVFKEADARITARREDEALAKTQPWERKSQTAYEKTDRTHEGTKPSLAVRAAMAVGHLSR